MSKTAATFTPSPLASQSALAWWTRAWCESASGMVAVGIRQLELARTLNGGALAVWEGVALGATRAAPRTAPVAAEPVATEPAVEAAAPELAPVIAAAETVEPAAVEPVAAEPVAVEPPAAAPVAVAPVAVEAVAKQAEVSAPKPAALRVKRGRSKG